YNGYRGLRPLIAGSVDDSAGDGGGGRWVPEFAPTDCAPPPPNPTSREPESDAIARVDEPATKQPAARIGGIFLEPAPCAAEPEGISPGVHVAQHAFTAEHRQLVGQQDLQVADTALFFVVTPRVAIERIAAFRRHAYEVAELVQQRVHGSVRAHVQRVAAQARLALAPVGAWKGVARRAECEFQAVAARKRGQRGIGIGFHANHGCGFGSRVHSTLRAPRAGASPAPPGRAPALPAGFPAHVPWRAIAPRRSSGRASRKFLRAR